MVFPILPNHKSTEGAKVVASDLDEKKLQAVVDEIKAAGGDGIAVGGDVGADDFPARILDAAIKRYGKLKSHRPSMTACCIRCPTMPDDAWDLILRILVRAPFRLIRAATLFMRIRTEPGTPPEKHSIINISSISGLHDHVGQANYAAAK
ncbi:hypothetical protein BJV78DRAFT_1285069 [Lactifluus subvellereus]|nr:hypothetical protein BJV78DRAFT_1285069 [Lactifluus subvellereus]